MKAAQRNAFAFGLALALSASSSFAQIAGGGNAGWLSGLWNTFLTNIAPGLGMAAIVVIGILAMGARLGLILVCGIIIGIYVINHADTIYSLVAGN